jgi:hypothetical protein
MSSSEKTKDWHRVYWPSGIYTVIEANVKQKSKQIYFCCGIINEIEELPDLMFLPTGELLMILRKLENIKILGVKSDLNFPVKFPLKLDNKIITK